MRACDTGQAAYECGNTAPFDKPVVPPVYCSCAVSEAFALAITRGSPERFTRLLKLFSSNHIEDVDKLRAALADGDRDLAGRIVHSLKGAAGTLCINRVYRLARRRNTSDIVTLLISLAFLAWNLVRYFTQGW